MIYFKYFLVFLALIFIESCEKEKDPLIRIKNDAFYHDDYFQIWKFQGTSYALNIDSFYVEYESYSSYISINEGNYRVSTIDTPIVQAYQPFFKNKKYTVHFYVNEFEKTVVKVLEP